MRFSARISVLSLGISLALVTAAGVAPAFAVWRPDSLWMRDYGGPYSDHCRAVVNGPDGGFVFCGLTSTGEDVPSDIVLTSVDAWGNVLWSQTYGGPGYEAAYDVVACSDGGYFIAGLTSSWGAGGTDIYVIRTDADGDTLWTRTVGGPGSEYAYGASIAFEGAGFVVTGSTDSFGAGMVDVYLVSFDADGDTVWTRTYGMTDTEWGGSVVHTTDGGYAILGTTRSWGLGWDDFYFIKTNSSGVMTDQVTYGGPQNDEGDDLLQTSDGGYILVGGTHSYGTGGDVLAIKTRPNFTIDWMKNLGYDEWDVGYQVIVNSGGNYVIAGITRDSGDENYYVAELDGGGVLEWATSYGGPSTDRGYSIVETLDFGYVVAGISYSFGDVNQALLVRLNGTLPMIRGVTDIPNDQGRRVRISWFSSSYDHPDSYYDIYDYTIWRRIDEWTLSGACAVPALCPGLTYPPGKWEYVATVPAMGELEYNTVVPTLCDSTMAEGMCYSAFCVMAHTSEPLLYFTSFVDSGYSVDNLAPSAPANLHMPTDTDLAWDEAPEEDFDYFTVYGAYGPDFAGASFMGYTIDTDYDVTGGIYNYYFVTATDFSGNEGDPAIVENASTAVPGGASPVAFALRQNRPNPFRGSTAIGFDLPRDCRVTLEVIDVYGRVVATLVDRTCAAGRHTASWNGLDAPGAEAGPGVYFVRMKAGGFNATGKVLLLK